MKIVAIVNPVAGKGRAARDWPRLLAAAAAGVTTWWTSAPGEAEALAARACREGFDRVIAVGGDGTLSEAANGLWGGSAGPRPSLAMVPCGTGCDYPRNFKLGSSPAECLQTALRGATAPIDVGLCRLTGLDGEPRQRIFVNILGLGFDARVVRRFQLRRSLLRGKAAYLVCGLQELLRLQSHLVKGEIDGRPLKTRVNILLAGLGRCFGGGLMAAPQASPRSGRFQVVWLQPVSRPKLLTMLPLIWTGRHLKHPAIQSQFAGSLRLSAEPPALVEADGELIGQTPIEVEIRRQALFLATPALKDGMGAPI
jgi:YegS/Rv2252/BmrU family lipid kinase